MGYIKLAIVALALIKEIIAYLRENEDDNAAAADKIKLLGDAMKKSRKEGDNSEIPDAVYDLKLPGVSKP